MTTMTPPPDQLAAVEPATSTRAGRVPRPSRGRRPARGSRAARGRKALGWAALGLVMLVTLFPFYWMLRTSLSTTVSLGSDPGSLLPVDFTLGAYQRVLGLATTQEALAEGGSGASINFWSYLRNSLIVATVTTVGQVLFCSMAAYAFARLRWPGRNLVFAAFISALMVPPIFTTIPNFVTIRELGLLNTYAGIILPTLLMTPFAVFFLRQFFLSISREVEEAAIIDGAGPVRRFFQVILPLGAAPITTLAILTYITSWNEYFWPQLVGRTEEVRVLTVALGVFRSQTPQGGPDWAGLMAATLIAALPILVLFAILGRRVINNIGYSGTK
ncbi:multiple sugar transport system permease protein [Frigoribacterium sp. PhB160]|jgi:multiple sugar transport system permease protein|uniref:carbohydrate ABC transporter permease n=1 Tax=Frigoribacterium sp. PhB160 TaxID=2485192 RepID=UPI000FB77DFC|nr:carbohydrate ABC transporter permease [Frigoribacterium sp. PhB160]ROS62631.1 multiple sugar transport system permease protein [Frigoribacterium sp. PhB160]